MRLLPLVALTLLAACSKGGGTTEIVVRDSAGVQIIEHPAGAIEGAPLWSTAPAVVTIAGLGGEEETFTRVTGARRLADGRFLVVDFDNSAAQPAIFSADGTFERKIGRPGSGPGEFRFAYILGILPGDTILFYDFQAMRITRMLPSGTLITTENLGTVGMMAIGSPSGRLSDGRLVSVPFPMEDTASHGTTLFRQRLPVILIDPAQQRIDTVTFAVPGDEMYMATMDFGEESGTFPSPAPYGRRSQLVAAGDRIVVTDNDSPDVVSYLLPWKAQRITRFVRPRRPVDEASRTGFVAYRQAEVDRLANRPAAVREVMMKQVREAEYPDSMGFYAMATLAADSTLWLAEMRPMNDSIPTYTLVGADGRLRARVTLPAGSRLLWAGAAEVLLLLRDEDDVERVELRPIVKGAAAP